MTKLREDFISYLQLLGHAPKTIKDYVNGVSQLAQHYNKSPLVLTPQEVIEFLLHIRNVRKLAVRTYNNYFYSIKKFYEHFLPNTSFLGDLRRMREPVHHPIVLSKEDVLTLIDSAANLKIKAAIALFYASGIRVEECSLLKISCIDRKRMVIRIELGKPFSLLYNRRKNRVPKNRGCPGISELKNAPERILFAVKSAARDRLY